MARYFFALGFLACITASRAQLSPVDSATYYFDHGQLVRARQLLKDLSRSTISPEALYLLGSVNEEAGYLNDALQDYSDCLARANPKQQAAALTGTATVSTALGKYETVLQNIARSRALDSTEVNLMRNEYAEGRYWHSQNEYDQALIHFQRTIDIATRLHNAKYIAWAWTSIGMISFSHNSDMAKAIECFNRSNEACDSLIHMDIIARNYGRIANALFVLGRGKDADVYLDRAEKIVSISGNKDVLSYIQSTRVIELFEANKLKEASVLARSAIEIKKELHQLRALQNDLLNASEIEIKMNDRHEGRKMLEEGMAISRQLQDIFYMKYFHDRFATLDSLDGDYKSAYSHLRAAQVLQDSVYSIQRLHALHDADVKYEASLKEKTIAEQYLIIRNQRFKTWLIVSGAIATVVALCGIILLLRNRNRLRLQQERQERLESVVQAQEEVQQRIARDLHDGLVQVLGAAKMNLQSVGPDSSSLATRERIQNASKIIDDGITEARSISHRALPYSLLREGLVPALRQLVSTSFTNQSFSATSDEIVVPQDTAVNIYRIAQEIVTNVLKHAGDVPVNSSITSIGSGLQLVIEDGGKGFDGLEPFTGAGIRNMRTRCELIGGVLTIQSKLGKGTRIELNVPL